MVTGMRHTAVLVLGCLLLSAMVACGGGSSSLADEAFNRGVDYSDQGDYENAIEAYDEAIRLDPQDAYAYNNRGNAYKYLGKYERAIQDFDEAIRLAPDDADAYHNRGNAYALLDQYERAIEDYDEAIRLNPKYAKAYGHRGYAYGNLGQHERAIEDLDEAIRLDPKYAKAYGDAYRWRGKAYEALGNQAQADADYAKWRSSPKYKELVGE